MKKILMAVFIAFVLNFSSVQAATVFSPVFNYSTQAFEGADFLYSDDLVGYQLGLFDYTVTEFTTATALMIDTGESVSFLRDVSGGFTASNNATNESIDVTATAGTPSFILALFDTVTWHEDTGATSLAGSWLTISFGENLTDVIQGVDVMVSAVPIPAAVWLFATGMVGLIGIAKRNKAVA